MTRIQYTYFKRAVQQFLDVNEVKPGCFAAVNASTGPFFSKSQCECCKSPLGGNRETCAFIGNVNFTADICEDCIYYLTYGRLDDTTMAEMD